jgi:hypothetical protein
MYRLSNHWGRLANSKWRLIAADTETSSKLKLGLLTGLTFTQIITMISCIILANYEGATVSYEHKNNPL